MNLTDVAVTHTFPSTNLNSSSVSAFFFHYYCILFLPVIIYIVVLFVLYSIIFITLFAFGYARRSFIMDSTMSNGFKGDRKVDPNVIT